MQPEENITKINIDLMIPNFNQPRKVFNDESLKELALSIKEYGILNPILVRKKDNLYEIIAGERRYRAAKMIGLKEVPVIIKNIAEEKIPEIALIENLQRENISPIEEAKSYQEILKLSNLKEQELSTIIGKSQSYISNKLRLLKLPKNIQDALINKKISERHARSLIVVNDSKRQNELLNRIINEKLTVKELETIINEKEITDAEIKSAIDDIMKSLNISSESTNKEEEKESDKMNNGNFFPNNNLGQNQNATLNAMNMQTLNTMSAQNSQGIMPQIEPTMIQSFEPSNQPLVYNQPVPESQPVNQIPNPSPIPNFNVSQMPEQTPISNPTLEVQETIPSFEPSLVQPEINNNFSIAPQVGPVLPNEITNQTPMMDQPLFDQSSQIPQQIEPTMSQPTPSYEIPVTTDIPLPSVEPQNKLADVETFLNNNGINYKKYSNETGHCIIIEL